MLIHTKELANMFYNLAVEHQHGDATATEASLIHVQQRIAKMLPPEEQIQFQSDCGLLYW
jgi:hypothetical protein